MGDFAGPLSITIFGCGVVPAVREGGQGLQTMRREWITQCLRIGGMTRVRIAKRRHAWRRKRREHDKGAKTVVIQIVILFTNDVPARQLRHKVECRRSYNGAEERFPMTTIGPDGP
jgi:hypothetical protein